MKRCGPSCRHTRNASAVFKIFVLHPKKTFATISALFGHGAMSDLSPLCAPKRTSVDHSEFMVHALVAGEDDQNASRHKSSEIPKFRLPMDPNHFYTHHRPAHRGACARHERGAGCGGRGSVRRAIASRTNDAEADGQGEGFSRPRGGVKTARRRAGDRDN